MTEPKTMTLGLVMANLETIAEKVGRDVKVFGVMVTQPDGVEEFGTLTRSIDPLVLMIPTEGLDKICRRCGGQH
jgi:hypothetical protein